MACASSLVFFLFCHLLFLSSAEQGTGFNPRCPPLPCGVLGNISFPFSPRTHPECGLLVVDNCDTPLSKQQIQLGKDGPSFYVAEIRQDNILVLRDHPDPEFYKSHCPSFQNLTLFSTSLYSFEYPNPSTALNCSNYSNTTKLNLMCKESNHSLYYSYTRNGWKSPPAGCSVVQALVNKASKYVLIYDMYTGWFRLRVNVIPECHECYLRGGQCLSDSNANFKCSAARKGNGKKRLALILGLGIGGSVILIAVLSIFIKHLRKKGKYVSPNFHSGNTSSYPSSKSELEESNVYFGAPVFTYSELAEATNNFNQDKELGDGGFGLVYHGKLKDEREVAVKCLYEHNYRRVEQFMNEIKILTCLRHKKHCSLYGCTSRHSQGLLIVYEFVPNGTVADHLHDDQANPCLFTWPIRMNIAIETATALSYLHASGIIHRDVKTDNILLDNNFCVKVADFGLSRLFPTHVTHVSIAPQGTPGYVDPEYHQYYQLTEKSDVYSFGVVLIELISAMPAVDISRHKHEINLANLEIDRIQKHAVDELIDPCLGVHLDEEVRRMATSVAELAFICLQQNKEVRPTMAVVLEELQRIKRRECKPEKVKEEDDNGKEELKTMRQPPPSPPQNDKSALLKNVNLPPSPISITDNWLSNDTTPNVSN